MILHIRNLKDSTKKKKNNNTTKTSKNCSNKYSVKFQDIKSTYRNQFSFYALKINIEEGYFKNNHIYDYIIKIKIFRNKLNQGCERFVC